MAAQCDYCIFVVASTNRIKEQEDYEFAKPKRFLIELTCLYDPNTKSKCAQVLKDFARENNCLR